MSIYRLKKYSTGDGDPIDTSDALTILSEIEKIKIEAYNSGLDTAMALVEEALDYEARMVGTYDTIMCGLESSKLNKLKYADDEK